MDKYVFNSKFFGELQARKRLSKKDILRVLGTHDYSSLTRWLDGIGAPPLEQMLKLCNEYDISPAQWFLHNGEPETMKVDENPFQVTKVVAGEGMVTETDVLKLQLAHAQEVNEIERNARQREDQIRRDCQINFDKERSRLMDIIERQNNEIIKQKQQERTGYRVAETQPEHNIVPGENEE